MNPTDLLLRQSRLAGFCLIGLHLAAILAAFCLPLAWCLSALAGIGMHWLWQSRRHGLPVSLHILHDGQVELTWPDGRQQTGVFRKSTVVTSRLIILHLADEGRRIFVVLWPDSADKEVLRQWRVWLRWKLPAMQRRLESFDENDQN